MVTQSCYKTVFITCNHAVICVKSGCVPAVSAAAYAAKTLCITWRGIFQQNDLIFPPLPINNNDVHIRIMFTMQRQTKKKHALGFFQHSGEKSFAETSKYL